MCLKCAAAKTDRTQAHVSLPRKRYKATHTHRPCLFPRTRKHTHTHTPYLSNSVSSNSFLSQTVFTHAHEHTCSPHPAKRERWLVNKQWHSARSVTRPSFDQHCCSCSSQQCFLSFCPLNAAMHTLANTRTHTPMNL